jgi:hypothetical protein
MFNWIDSAWHRVTGTIDSTIANWVHALIRGLYSFLHVIFGDVGKAWDAFWKDVHVFAATVGMYFDATMVSLNAVYGWINSEGNKAYYYISNPIKLVDLIYNELLGKIEATAEDTAERLGKFVLALIVKNVKTIVTVVEDIFDAVL